MAQHDPHDQHGQDLDSALREVDADERCARLAAELPRYAREELEKHLPAIRGILRREVEARPTWQRTVDLLWPGSGYNSVACGGNFEVLALLERERLNDHFVESDAAAEPLLRIGRIMGASGGAASALLAISDPEGSSATLLRYYMAYALWSLKTSDYQIVSETPVWNHIYHRCIADDAAFARVKEKGWVAVAKGMRFHNAVYYNFRTREQCVQAYYASGNASVTGMFRGTSIDGVDGKVSDGGQMSFFPHGNNALLYFNTSYESSSAMNCTLDSIETLYRAGVDQTIRTLISEGLHEGKDARGCGGMTLCLPGESGAAHRDEFERLKAAFALRGSPTAFHDIEADVKHKH